MAPEENKAVISKFVEEVINQGQLERADDLVAVDFVELDPLPGQQQGREGLKQVINVHASRRVLWRSCHRQARNCQGHGGRSRGRRQDGGESNL